MHTMVLLKGKHYLGEWLLVNAQASSSEGVFTCTSGSSIGVLGKLILQVTDSLLLRQNCGLQILNLLQQPLKQLRLDRRGGERSGGVGKRETEEESKKRQWQRGEIKDKEKEENRS